jgi:hypothetical protein
MADPSKKMCVSDNEVFYELLQENEYSGISESEYSSNFPFAGKPGINVDLKDSINTLEYFELFCKQDIAEVTARETDRYAQKCSENTPNLKLKSRTHRWAGTKNYIIIKYSQYLPLGLQQRFQRYNHFNDDFIVCKRKLFCSDVWKNSSVHLY